MKCIDEGEAEGDKVNTSVSMKEKRKAIEPTLLHIGLLVRLRREVEREGTRCDGSIRARRSILHSISYRSKINFMPTYHFAHERKKQDQQQ